MEVAVSQEQRQILRLEPDKHIPEADIRVANLLELPQPTEADTLVAIPQAAPFLEAWDDHSLAADNLGAIQPGPGPTHWLVGGADGRDCYCLTRVLVRS
jgi:hypothetical protein